jgi:hypothetical protein
MTNHVARAREKQRSNHPTDLDGNVENGGAGTHELTLPLRIRHGSDHVHVF